MRQLLLSGHWSFFRQLHPDFGLAAGVLRTLLLCCLMMRSMLSIRYPSETENAKTALNSPSTSGNSRTNILATKYTGPYSQNVYMYIYIYIYQLNISQMSSECSIEKLERNIRSDKSTQDLAWHIYYYLVSYRTTCAAFIR